MTIAQDTKVVDTKIDFWTNANEKYYKEIGYTHLTFLGVCVAKCPSDLWVYQELIYKTRPDLIIETGTSHGGSALYLASMCQLIGNGRVITIDIKEPPYKFKHERLEFITGSSVDPEIVDRIEDVAPGKKIMVVLDSDHHKDHVLKELSLYAPLVSYGSYLIVEDTNINGHPVYPEHGPGPMEALDEWLPKHGEFAIEKGCERFGITFNPNGYLRRIR